MASPSSSAVAEGSTKRKKGASAPHLKSRSKNARKLKRQAEDAEITQLEQGATSFRREGHARGARHQKHPHRTHQAQGEQDAEHPEPAAGLRLPGAADQAPRTEGVRLVCALDPPAEEQGDL
ncbi:hypothetical protein L1887_53923 [Cichorium endivia]|nr:hypothetical protein L1887_53923 [Cichorium endivia]